MYIFNNNLSYTTKGSRIPSTRIKSSNKAVFSRHTEIPTSDDSCDKHKGRGVDCHTDRGRSILCMEYNRWVGAGIMSHLCFFIKINLRYE